MGWREGTRKEMGRGVQVGGKDVQRRRYSQEEREKESE